MATVDALKTPKIDPLEVETPDGYELIDGKLVEKKLGKDASQIASRIMGELYIHCKQTGAGVPLHADAAFRCFPKRKKHVRKPDVSFIRRARFEPIQPGPGDFTIPPDLVVEVCSPYETVRRIKGKVKDWRSVAVPVIWVIEPESRTATVYVGKDIYELGENDELPVGDVLQGFRLKLTDVLLPPSRAEAAP